MRVLTKVCRVKSTLLAVGLALVLMSGPDVFGMRRAGPERKLEIRK